MGAIMKTSSTWIVGLLAAGIAVYVLNKNKKAQQIALSTNVAGTRG
jgi:hypothetical protein